MLSKFILSWMLSLVSASLEALFFFSGNHTFFGGSSRVVKAMSSDDREREDRSRSPARVPSNEGKDKTAEDGTGESGLAGGGNQSALGDQVGPGADDVKTEEEKGPAPVAPTPEEENSGRVLLNSIISASKSLETCAAQLEANAGLLETMRADSSSINSLAAGVKLLCINDKSSTSCTKC